MDYDVFLGGLSVSFQGVPSDEPAGLVATAYLKGWNDGHQLHPLVFTDVPGSQAFVEDTFRFLQKHGKAVLLLESDDKSGQLVLVGLGDDGTMRPMMFTQKAGDLKDDFLAGCTELRCRVVH